MEEVFRLMTMPRTDARRTPDTAGFSWSKSLSACSALLPPQGLRSHSWQFPFVEQLPESYHAGTLSLSMHLTLGSHGRIADEIALFCISCFCWGAIFLVLFVGDWQMKWGEDRLSKTAPQSVLEADPNLNLVSERSPYMRTER
jgi:hypothetical protein